MVLTKPNRADMETILPGLEYIDSVVKLDDGLILIHDLERYTLLSKVEALDRATVAADRCG
jgi:purine-binding chemotaxis protein CheW